MFLLAREKPDKDGHCSEAQGKQIKEITTVTSCKGTLLHCGSIQEGMFVRVD